MKKLLVTLLLSLSLISVVACKKEGSAAAQAESNPSQESTLSLEGAGS